VFRAPCTQKVQWDPVRDVTPIIQISGVTFGVLVRTREPVPGAGRPVRVLRVPGPAS